MRNTEPSLAVARRLGTLALLGAFVLAGGGCLFEFNRDVGLAPGDVQGRALREGQGAAFAKVLPDGSARLFTANSDGAFLVRGLSPGGWVLRITDDEDGDGWPERAAYRSFALTARPVAEGLFGESAPRLGFLLLGDIPLEGIVEARGTVRLSPGSAPVAGARVYAFRGARVPSAQDDGAAAGAELEVDLAAEAVTTTDDQGRFYFPALAAGSLSFAAFYEQDAVRYASAPVVKDAVSGEAIAEDELDLVVAAVPSNRRARVELAPAPVADERVKVLLSTVGSPPPDCGSETFDDGDPWVSVGTASVLIDVPVDIFDLHVCTSEGRRGMLQRRVASPPGRQVLVWGPVLLSMEDRCQGSSPDGEPIRDCDHDGWQALPAFDPELAPDDDPARSVWALCGEVCYQGFGSRAPVQKCTVSGEDYDCDDDGDGQPDMTEPVACHDPAAGNDSDGDGLCDFGDPFPQCASNDAADPACGADRPPSRGTRPPVRPEYGGGAQPPPDGGLVDAGVDGGLVDGGLDGGLVDAAPDGGLVDAGLDGGVDAGSDGGPAPGLRWPGAHDLGAAVDYVEALVPLAGGGYAILAAANEPTDVLGCFVEPGLGPGEGGSPFFAAIGPDGVCRWARTLLEVPSAPDAGPHFPYARISTVVARPSGGLLVVGSFSDGDLRLESSDGSFADVLAGAGSNFFAARYSAAGDVEQVTHFRADPGYGDVVDAAVFADDAFVIAGSLSGTLTFAEASSLNLTSSQYDLFFVGFAPDGTPAWSMLSESTGSFPDVQGVVALGSGSERRAVAVGHFTSRLFPPPHTLDGANGQAFVVALDASGGLLWTTQASGTSGYGLRLAAREASRDVVLAAASSSLSYLAPGTGATTTLTSATPGSTDGFFLLLDENGSVTGQYQISSEDGSSSLFIEDVSSGESGKVAVTGGFSSPVVVPTASDPERLVADRGSGLAFALFLDPSSPSGFTAAWAQQTRGGGWHSAAAVAVLDDDSAVVGGSFDGNVHFGGAAVDPLGYSSFLWHIAPDGMSHDELLPPLGSACETAELCADEMCRRYGQLPEEGYCTAPCTQGGSECPAPWTCDVRTGTCVPECLSNDECALDEVCHHGERSCVPDCRSVGNGCAVDEVCNDAGICRLNCIDFGGCDEASEFCDAQGMCRMLTVLDDVWQWSNAQYQWGDVTPTVGPGERRDAAATAVYDASGTPVYAVVFGGAAREGQLLGDTWVYDVMAGAWSQALSSSAPSPREGARMAVDPMSQTVVLFGGRSQAGYEADAWTFDVMTGEWSELVVTGAPSGRAFHALTYAASGSFLLFGGFDGVPLDDTWFLDVNTPSWSPSSAQGPSARSHAALASDGAGLIVLFGGFAAGQLGLEPLGDTWVWIRSGWSLVSNANNPGSRGGATLQWDPVGGVLVLSGGDSGDQGGIVFDDVLLFSSGYWNSTSTFTRPPPRTSAASAHDGAGVLVIGGSSVAHSEMLTE